MLEKLWVKQHPILWGPLWMPAGRCHVYFPKSTNLWASRGTNALKSTLWSDLWVLPEHPPPVEREKHLGGDWGWHFSCVLGSTGHLIMGSGTWPDGERELHSCLSDPWGRLGASRSTRTPSKNSRVAPWVLMSSSQVQPPCKSSLNCRPRACNRDLCQYPYSKKCF